MRNVKRGFTLIELLVAIAVLVILLGLLTNVFSSVSRAWLHSQEKLDNFARGRALLSAMERDLRSAVIRQDLPAFPATNINGEAALSFFARTFGQQTDSGNLRPLTYIVYYQGTNGSITRRDQPFDFDTPLTAWSPFGTNVALPAGSGVASIERQLCPGVLAFHFRFLQSDGSTSDTFAGVPLKESDPSQLDLSKPRTVAVRLSVAIASTPAETVLRQSGKEAALIALLQNNASSHAAGAKAGWDALLAGDPAFVSLGLPPLVQGGLRTYEKVAYLESSEVYTPQ